MMQGIRDVTSIRMSCKKQKLLQTLLRDRLQMVWANEGQKISSFKVEGSFFKTSKREKYLIPYVLGVDMYKRCKFFF